MKSDHSMTKILLVLEAWGPGGTETFVAGLIKLLISHKIDVYLVLLKENDKVNIDCLSPKKISVTGYFGLIGRLVKDRPHVINLHLYTSLLPVVIIARLMDIAVVTTLHMPLSAWSLRHRLYWWLAVRLSSTVVGVSHLVLNQLTLNNSYSKPVPGGVDSLFFQCKRSNIDSETYYLIVAMGRLAVEKDWPTLIRAVAMLPESSRNCIIIHFYGSGSQLAELKILASQKGVRAIFHGYVEKSVLVGALSKASLSVLPSRFEGLGLSALEGMAAGVPTITADFPAAHDFIEHGVTGHRFPIGDAEALAQLIAWHMDNPDESNRIGLSGQRFVREYFSQETTYLPYLEIFQKPCGGCA